MVQPRNPTIRPLLAASLASLSMLLLLATSSVPVARAAGSAPVVSRAILYWEHSPSMFDEGVNLWWIRFNVVGTDSDSASLKRRILVLDKTGTQMGMVVDDGYEWNNPMNPPADTGGPRLGFEDTRPENIAQYVGGRLVMWLEDYDGNVSEVITLPISAPQKRTKGPVIDEAAVENGPGGKIVVSGVNLTEGKVTVNGTRVAPGAVTFAEDGTAATISMADAGLEPASGYQIRIGSGKRRSNPIFVRP